MKSFKELKIKKIGKPISYFLVVLLNIVFCLIEMFIFLTGIYYLTQNYDIGFPICVVVYLLLIGIHSYLVLKIN